MLPIKDSSALADATDYVTDTIKPEVVALSWHLGNPSSDGKYTVSIGAHVTAAAPPPAQVISAADLGL